MKKVIESNWNLCKINKKFQEIVQQILILAFTRNENIHDLLGCKNIVNNRVQKKSRNKISLFIKCFSKPENLCYTQVVHSSNLTRNVTKKVTASYIILIVKINL